MKLIEISIPEYTVETEPDIRAIGKKIDDVLKENFLGQTILYRYVASAEYPKLSVDELIEIIKSIGTDRYDLGRAGDRYDNTEGKQIDLFACLETITIESKLSEEVMIWGFYHSAIAVHGYPMRIDIVSIYDPTHFERVFHKYEGRDDIKDDGFAFKNPQNKTAALLGIIKLIKLMLGCKSFSYKHCRCKEYPCKLQHSQFATIRV